MTDTPALTLPGMFARTAARHGSRPALAMVGETPVTYDEADRRIRSVIALLKRSGLRPGDRVAILGANMPNWSIGYYAVTFSGGVAVPLLPEFHPGEIATILDHAGPVILIVSDSLRKKVASHEEKGSMVVIRMEDFTTVAGDSADKAFPAEGSPAGHAVEPDDLAAIIYTSGTTGKPKGVMLTHRNLCFTAMKSGRVQEIIETDRFLSVLPLSHTYENTIGMILPMISGACVYYLGKAPTPAILLPALQEVKPTIMLTVPLIIEKIFRNVILPKFNGSRVMRTLSRFGPTRRLLNRVAGRKLMTTFGGELRFFGIGGAKLNRTVEKFLIEAKFPYAIGYGLTETSPLLAGFNPKDYRLQSTGPAIEGIELVIHDPDPKTGEGEIRARGPNVMKGYYREPELTAEILTPDGWLKTGDLGVMDRDGYLYIKGRLKNVIILSGGENIYPEEIESVINNFKHVLDSLVLEQKGKLVALVHFNREEIEQRYGHLQQEFIDFVERMIEELRNELQQYVNHRMNRFSQVQAVIVHPEPFEKTATMKIKRYLYG